MEIKIENKIPDIKVEVNQSADGSYSIKLFQTKEKVLGDVKVGDTVTIGEREYIVLEHSADTTAVIVKKPVKSMAFGKDGDYSMAFGKDGDYTKSDVRTYCNGEFYKELCKAVGRKNIIPHTVNLVSDDGSNKGASVKDNVSILTTDLYRRYRELLPAIGSSCWTATRVTTFNKGYARYVCCVGSNGILCWDCCDFSYSVRPFCILNSSILVS